MKMILLTGLVLLLTACGYFSVVRTERLVKVPVQAPTHPQSGNSTISVAQLLAVRQALCRLPDVERQRRLEFYRQVFIEKQGAHVNGEADSDISQRTDLLYALMMATCEPHQAPGLVTEILREVDANGNWPEEHRALFDLLTAEQRSYAVLDEKYQALLKQHERTIQGIKKIETEIDQVDEPKP